jgi:hypothetical protein
MLRRENRNAMAEILQYQKAAGAAVIQTRRHAHSNPIQVVAARQAGPALLRSEAYASLHQKRKDTVMFMRFFRRHWRWCLHHLCWWRLWAKLTVVFGAWKSNRKVADSIIVF